VCPPEDEKWVLGRYRRTNLLYNLFHVRHSLFWRGKARPGRKKRDVKNTAAVQIHRASKSPRSSVLTVQFTADVVVRGTDHKCRGMSHLHVLPSCLIQLSLLPALTDIPSLILAKNGKVEKQKTFMKINHYLSPSSTSPTRMRNQR